MANLLKLQKLISPNFTQDVIMNMLQKECGSDQVVINDINFGAELKKGDSYQSNVTKFSIDYEYNDGNGLHRKTLHVLVKALMKNLARRKTFRSAEFFANEMEFYDKVWPALDAYQKSKKPKQLFVEIPNCLATFVDGENDFIALEDLSFAGYRGAERGSGLDSYHVNIVIKTFARFHALSLAYKQENPEGFKKLDSWIQEIYFGNAQRTWYQGFQTNLKEVVRDAVSQELPEMYLNKLDQLFSTDLFGELIKSCAERDSLSVVSHGDAWIPNFLLRYDDNHTPQHAIMIDFQLARISSLALDLHFFLYSCADGNFLDNHYHETLDYYCDNFNEFLIDLDCKANLLTKEILLEELKRHGAFSIAMPLEGVLLALLEDHEILDLNEIPGDQAVPLESVLIIKPLKTKEKRQRAANFVKHAVDNKFI